ncbi:acyltransferase [Bradyrhizobium sp. sBnM-33]|uniref:acyltransferase n=1 Tax=Bradyrhizobium sp. sBnM-33 TaxID=2831780 RepID=UPI001BCC329A|nr:acyltransferase [Bradyrhizobium sp. sBnM-33]WOH48831.1 acyltransferase [Bradyrhizobium sp. sBnM-33]
MRRILIGLIDAILGWKSRFSGAVSIGRGSTIAWRRIRRAAGNVLSVGEDSIVHADISFEETGGKIQIGSRTFIGRSHLVCYRSLSIGDDVIMSWGITIVDHDSHSVDWIDRRNDVREWSAGRKDWKKIAHAPVVVSNRAWIGFNVSVLKGVTIGEGAAIGACSVVTRDVPPYTLAAGNPARVIRTLSAPPDASIEG